MKNKILLFALAIGIVACGKKSDENVKEQVRAIDSAMNADLPYAENQIAPTILPNGTPYVTKSGKMFLVDEQHPMGLSLSTVTVNTTGFPTDFNYIMSDINPLSGGFFADLDNNGFEEFYLVSTSVGSGSYGSLYGFASNRDLSVSLVNTESTAGDNGGKIKNYMGHDRFAVINGKLVRSYPIYKDGDQNCCPTGGKKSIN